jgi:hypothetical protein
MHYFSDIATSPWLLSIALVTASSLMMYVIKRITLVRLGNSRLLAEYPLTKIALQALRRPLSLIIVALNLGLLSVLLNHYEVGSNKLEAAIDLTVKIAIMLSIMLFAERFLSYLIVHFAATSEALNTSKSIVIPIPLNI